MSTRVVNVHREPYDVYIGRTVRSNLDAVFGNPYPIGKVCGRCGVLHATRASTLPCFEAYFRERVERDRDFRLRVLRLRGQRLGCHCAPDVCHGDIIAKYVDQEQP